MFFYVLLALRIMTLVTIEQEQKYISNNAIKELPSWVLMLKFIY